MRGVEFIDEPFEVTIKGGVVVVAYPSGDKRAVPITVFREIIARGKAALAEFDAKRAVVQLGARH